MRRLFLTAIGGWFALAFLAWPQVDARGQNASTQDDVITPALERLLKRAGRTFVYVIVEHEQSEKFVQFAVDKGRLIVDLPLTTLDRGERDRAATVFQEIGVSGPNRLKVEMEGKPQGTRLQAFQAEFGTDTARAAAFARRIFTEVYRLPETAQLSVLEGDQG